MDLNSIPLIGMLRAKMSWLGERQRVLADNVANADVPGFQAQDLKEIDFAQMVQNIDTEMGVARTHSKHMGISGANAGTHRVIDAPDWEVTPDGNSVVLEEQMMKVAATQMEFQSAAQLYRKSVDMIRLALSRGR